MAPSAQSEVKYDDLTTLEVKFASEHVLSVALNRPKNLNSMNKSFWTDCRVCFQRAGSDPRVRAIVLSANGRMFSAGLDLSDSILDTMKTSQTDTARTAFLLRKEILALQSSFDELENCNKPVICVSHGASVGAGVDLAAAADIRYATKDAYFTIKEVDVALAADVGTLSRMPRVIGNDSM
jgi:delta(3,5)-delta(2,4)-dienoyl-CoA isomerase